MDRHIPQILYNKILKNIPIVCIDVAIIHGSKALLIKRKDEPGLNQWWVPGGRLYKGEDLQKCAKRKALEETGLECTVGDCIHVSNTIFETGPNNIPVHSVNLCYRLEPKYKKIKLDDHSSDYKWVQYVSQEKLHTYVEICLLKSGIKNLTPEEEIEAQKIDFTISPY